MQHSLNRISGCAVVLEGDGGSDVTGLKVGGTVQEELPVVECVTSLASLATSKARVTFRMFFSALPGEALCSANRGFAIMSTVSLYVEVVSQVRSRQ